MSSSGVTTILSVTCAAVIVMMVMDIGSAMAVNPRALQEDSLPVAVRLELMHRSHQDAPFTEHYGLRIDRVRSAVTRTRARLQVLKSWRSAANRNHQKISNPVSRAPLLGEYLMSVTVGTPPVTFNGMVLDTGSDLTWVGCSPCRQCKLVRLFDPKKSSSFKLAACRADKLCKTLVADGYSSCTSKSKTCAYTYRYQDESGSTGNLAYETIYLSTTNGKTRAVPHFGFGCSHKIFGDWTGSHGLAGFGRGPLSLPSQLSSVFGSVFSYCLLSSDDALNQTSPLLLGELPIPETDMKYTPMLYNEKYYTFYYVEMTGISVGGSTLKIPGSTFQIDRQGNGGTVFDSGTQLTSLAVAAYRALIHALKMSVRYHEVKGTDSVLELCYNISGVHKPVFPTITFHFKGADMVLADDNSFMPIDDDDSKVMCLAMVSSDPGPVEGPASIVGNVQQQNFLISYNTNPPQVGLVIKQCNSM